MAVIVSMGCLSIIQEKRQFCTVDNNSDNDKEESEYVSP